MRSSVLRCAGVLLLLGALACGPDDDGPNPAAADGGSSGAGAGGRSSGGAGASAAGSGGAGRAAAGSGGAGRAAAGSGVRADQDDAGAVDNDAGCTGSSCPAAKFCGARAGDSCAADEYCAYEPGQLCGAADAEATCKMRPNSCTGASAPVCGCDQHTYASACQAYVAGVGLYADGACK